MAKRLAVTLRLEVDRVSVKAKSPSIWAWWAGKEGIAAMAVVTVEAP
jgi:2C-methyl-D-erythritol 2,4-cyclodiphosphate synthase